MMHGMHYRCKYEKYYEINFDTQCEYRNCIWLTVPVAAIGQKNGDGSEDIPKLMTAKNFILYHIVR